MPSRENTVTVAFIVAAFALVYAALELTDLPTWGAPAILIGVGVIAPQLVNEYLDDTV